MRGFSNCIGAILVLSMFTISLNSCDLAPKDSSGSNIVKDKDGKIIEGTLVQKSPEGRVIRKTSYSNGMRNGISQQFYLDGKMRSEVTYADDKQNGPAKKYYKSGKLFQESNFTNGRLDGEIKKYHENGKLKSTQIYRNGQPGTELKEYLSTGKLKEKYPKLVIEIEDRRIVDGVYHLKFRLSNKSKRVSFYEGKLKDGFLPENLLEMSSPNGVYDKMVFNPPGEFIMEEVHVIARYTTGSQNPYLLTTSYDLALDGKY